MIEAETRPPLLRTFAVLRALACALGLVVMAWALLSQPAAAQAPPQAAGEKADGAGGVTAEELEGLVKTLKDDAARKDFIANLEALLEARRETTKPEEADRPGLSDRVAQYAAERVQRLSDRVAHVLGVIRLAPRMLDWGRSQIEIKAKRDRLIGLIWRFVAIVGLGMAAQYLFRKATGGARRRLEIVPPQEAVAARAIRFVARTVMLYLNALAYGLGAYAAYVALPMEAPAGAVLLVGASSFFAAKLILATARMVLSPGVPGLRLGTFSEETAQYLYIWVRRLVRIFVYAFFLVEATRLVGLPRPVYESLVYILGLALAGFLIVFVLQNRAGVAAFIRGAGRESLGGGARARAASLWHLAAIIYIVAVYLVWLFRVPGGFEFLIEATAWTVVILVAARLIVTLANRGLDRALRVGEDLAARYPGLEQRANRYMPVFRAIVRWTVFAFAGLAVLDAWGVSTLDWLASDEGTLLIRKLVIIAFILLAAFVVWEGLDLWIARQLERLDDTRKGAARARTLLPLARTTAAIVLVVLVVLIVLSEVGVNIAPLLAGAGVIGLAIGFGSQKLVQDVITGVFILAEDTLAVGDVVRFDANHSGLVEAFSIRTVRLRDFSGAVHTLPFSEVKTVVNMTKDFANYVLDVGVGYREDVDRVIAVLQDLGRELQEDKEYGVYMAEPIEIAGVDAFQESAVLIKARLKVVPPIKQWFVGREFNRRMKARFDKEGIEIPFPYRTIVFGEDSKGNAAPLRLAAVDAGAAAGEPHTATAENTDKEKKG